MSHHYTTSNKIEISIVLIIICNNTKQKSNECLNYTYQYELTPYPLKSHALYLKEIN